MEHLTCFLPGNLALGALHGAVATAEFPAYMAAAAAMTETCWQMYERTATGDLFNLYFCANFADFFQMYKLEIHVSYISLHQRTHVPDLAMQNLLPHAWDAA